eukprot:363284-Chlamydomonas_euryale.AAC.3
MLACLSAAWCTLACLCAAWCTRSLPWCLLCAWQSGALKAQPQGWECIEDSCKAGQLQGWECVEDGCKAGNAYRTAARLVMRRGQPQGWECVEDSCKAGNA